MNSTTTQKDTTSIQPKTSQLPVETTTILVTNEKQFNANQTSNTDQPQSSTSEPQSTASLILSTTNQKSSTNTETRTKKTSSLDQTTIGNTSSTTDPQLPDPLVISFLFVAVIGMVVICLCIFYIRTYKQRRSKVNREKKDQFTLETGDAKCTATAVLYDEIGPEIDITFVSPLRGTIEKKETKTARNKQIIDSDINSVNRERKDKLIWEIEEVKFTKTPVLYDDIEPNKEITFVSPLRGTGVEQELETTRNQQIIDSNTNLYVECPNNVYDKMFISRPHVNENQGNVYHTVDVRNNRYSLVKPIGTETTQPK